MSVSVSHPAYIELDAQHLGAADAAVAEHAAGCEQCRSYLVGLAAPLELPAWLPRARAPRRTAWVVPAVALAASLAVAVVVWPSTREKSAPAVLVHARGGIWDGRAAVHAGEAVQFEVFAGHHRHVTVVGRGPQRLFDAPLQPGETAVLPIGFAPERNEDPVWILLSGVRLDDAAVFDAAQRVRRDDDVWTVALTFSPEGSR